jgi:acyl carrier protein
MNIADNILNYIHSQLTSAASPIDVDSNLMESGHLDSTAMLELILWVGDTFDIAIQNEDLTLENFATPRNIVEFVERRKSEKLRDLQCDAAAST